MSSVPRVRRRLSAVLTSLALVAAMLVPLGGVASAASASTTCPVGEGGPSCELVISAPESVLTGVPFNVQVLVTTDGHTVATSDPCASKVAVELGVSDGEKTLATYTANASAGIATFSLTIPSDGSYRLEASAGSLSSAAPSTGCGAYSYFSASSPVMAVTVPPNQPIAPCPDNADVPADVQRERLSGDPRRGLWVLHGQLDVCSGWSSRVWGRPARAERRPEFRLQPRSRSWVRAPRRSSWRSRPAS